MARKTKKAQNSEKFYYVYRITFTHPDGLEGARYYYGQRTSIVPPEEDINYMSSSSVLKSMYKSYGLEWFKKKIIRQYPTKEEALAKEIELHDCFDVKNHPRFFNLANQLSTGFTTSAKLSADQIQKIREKALGRTHSAKSRALMSEQRRGRKRAPLSQEHKEKISKGLKNSPNRFGRYKHSPETRQKMSETRKNMEKVFPHSELTKQKISQTMIKVSAQRREKNQHHKCPHCGKVGQAPGIFSWHFTRCKYRREQVTK